MQITIRFLRFCLSNVQTKALCLKSLKTDVEHNRANINKSESLTRLVKNSLQFYLIHDYVPFLQHVN